MKKKILHIITSLSGGGAQRVLFRLIDSSKKKNSIYDHEILNLSGKGFYQDKFEKINIKVTNVGIPRGSFSFRHLINIIKFLNNIDLTTYKINGILNIPINLYIKNQLEEINAVFGQQQIENIVNTIKIIHNNLGVKNLSQIYVV